MNATEKDLDILARTRGTAVLRESHLIRSNLQVVVDHPSTVDGATGIDPVTFIGSSNLDKKHLA